MSFEEHMKPRVNGAILPNYVGKTVSLLGIAKDVDNSGNVFTLTACDNKDVRIMMQEPLQQPVSGLTEVYGMVKSANSVICDDYVVIPEEVSSKFNMSLYQKAVEYTQRCSDLFLYGGKPEA